MKMQGMSNKGKTSFKRQDRKFLVNVTLAAAYNWFGWQVLCEHGLERKAVCPSSQAVPVLKWNCTFHNAILSQGFYIEPLKCVVGTSKGDSSYIQPFCVFCLTIYYSALIFNTAVAESNDLEEITIFHLFIKLPMEINKHPTLEGITLGTDESLKRTYSEEESDALALASCKEM